MRFLVDSQLPQLLAKRLCEAGCESRHVLEIALSQSPDNDIWRHAVAEGMVIVTKDEDFAEWVIAGRTDSAVVWLRIGNCTSDVTFGISSHNGALIDSVETTQSVQVKELAT